MHVLYTEPLNQFRGQKLRVLNWWDPQLYAIVEYDGARLFLEKSNLIVLEEETIEFVDTLEQTIKDLEGDEYFTEKRHVVVNSMEEIARNLQWQTD